MSDERDQAKPGRVHSQKVTQDRGSLCGSLFAPKMTHDRGSLCFANKKPKVTNYLFCVCVAFGVALLIPTEASERKRIANHDQSRLRVLVVIGQLP